LTTRRPRASAALRANDAGCDAEWTPTQLDHVEAIAANPDLFALADILPERTNGDVGRPGTHPPVAYLLYCVLAGVIGSHRKAAALIAHPHCWNTIRRSARKVRAIRLPRKPPTRNQCEYHRSRIAAHVEPLLARFRELVIGQARQHGCLDPAAPRSTVELQRGTFAAVDGKVIRSPVRRITADKWRQQGRHVDGASFVQGGDDAHPVFGTKVLLAAVRPDNTRNDRIIVDVRHVPDRGTGGEAGIAVHALLDLTRRAPGLRGVCYDCALRGTHIDRLLKAGLQVLSPTHDGIKPTLLEQVSCPCGDTHNLWTANGRICQQVVLDDGDVVYQPCPVAKLAARPNPASRTWRWYLEFAAQPCGTIHTQRVDTTRDDRARSYNRAEHLRQRTKTSDNEPDSVYDNCRGWRSDAEALNDLLQSTLHKGRMISFRRDRQLLVILGFAIGRNSIARYLRLRRSADPPTAAA
jgi:hypothetical protein